MNKLDWNDLRYVLALIRQGSASAAAKMLGVSHATVLRRIQTVEKEVGTALFERLSTGYVSTEAGYAVVALGESIEAAITKTQRLIDGQASALAGSLRFTTTDSLANALLPPVLARFRAIYPDIRVQMVVSNELLSLDRRDADVALRPSLHPPEELVGMRLARMDFAIYAAPGYLDERRAVAWSDLDWLLPDGALAGSQAGQWARSAIASERVVATVDSFVSACSLAQAGVAATVLPCFLGDLAAGLQLVAAAPREASSEVWILTHENLRTSGRVRAFMDHLSQAFRAMRSRLQPDDSSTRASREATDA